MHLFPFCPNILHAFCTEDPQFTNHKYTGVVSKEWCKYSNTAHRSEKDAPDYYAWTYPNYSIKYFPMRPYNANKRKNIYIKTKNT